MFFVCLFFNSVLEGVCKEALFFFFKFSDQLVVSVHQEIKIFVVKTNKEKCSPREE